MTVLRAVLPALSLAIMPAHNLFGPPRTYLGGDAGRRVHAGAVERGSVESLHAVLWYADIRGFTAIAGANPGEPVVELLNEIFEGLTAPLRRCGGEVLKFLGDGMLAGFPLVDATRNCRSALVAAAKAMHALDRLNAGRCEAASWWLRSTSRCVSRKYRTAMSAPSSASTSR